MEEERLYTRLDMQMAFHSGESNLMIDWMAETVEQYETFTEFIETYNRNN